MFLYRIVLSLLIPVVLASLLSRIARGRERWSDLWQRLGGGRPPALPARRIWLHAASNGELAAVRPVLQALLDHKPDLHAIVTCNSLSGRDLINSWDDARITARLAPLDHRWSTARFLRRWQPALLIVAENELWPNRLAACQRRGIPIALVAARMSEGSARMWRRFPSAVRHLVGLDCLCAQDSASQARFADLGVPDRVILPPLVLKALYHPAPYRADPQGFARASTWLAASTHPGEDEVVLHAHSLILRDWPDAKLILAPRHPARAPEILRLIAAQGLSVGQRSQRALPGAQVYLADTLGEMPLWYDRAAICFVGGSLVPKGGHTPYEPAAHGMALLHGPSVFNAQTAYDQLQGHAAVVRSAQELAAAVLTLRPPSAQTAAGQAAQQALGQHTDLAPLLARLSALIDKAP